MPVVTDIKRQRKSEQRFNVYLDGTYAFAISDLDLSTSGLRVGQELSLEEVAVWQDQTVASKAYSRAVQYVSVRPRSKREMYDYLMRKDVPGPIAETTIARLSELGLLDDGAFAASWVANRQLLKPRSRRQLEQELMAKGVSRGDIATALDELGEDGEIEGLVELAEKKRRLPQYRDESKLMGYLSRQGFSYERIKKALELIAERSPE